METIDPNQALRVWQRVRGKDPLDTDAQALLTLITREWEDSVLYLQLSRRWGGKEGAALYQMFQQEQAHCTCLKGIYTMITRKKVGRLPTSPLPNEPIESILRSCYGREMHCLSTYEERSQDPDYGHVFARMRDQEQEHCRKILELIGSLGKK